MDNSSWCMRQTAHDCSKSNPRAIHPDRYPIGSLCAIEAV